MPAQFGARDPEEAWFEFSGLVTESRRGEAGAEHAKMPAQQARAPPLGQRVAAEAAREPVRLHPGRALIDDWRFAGPRDAVGGQGIQRFAELPGELPRGQVPAASTAQGSNADIIEMQGSQPVTGCEHGTVRKPSL